MCLLESLGRFFPWTTGIIWLLSGSSPSSNSLSAVTTLEALGWDSRYQHGSQVYFTGFLIIPSGMPITSGHSFMQLAHQLQNPFQSLCFPATAPWESAWNSLFQEQL